jgi:hypothetical protein
VKKNRKYEKSPIKPALASLSGARDNNCRF